MGSYEQWLDSLGKGGRMLDKSLIVLSEKHMECYKNQQVEGLRWRLVDSALIFFTRYATPATQGAHISFRYNLALRTTKFSFGMNTHRSTKCTNYGSELIVFQIYKIDLDDEVSVAGFHSIHDLHNMNIIPQAKSTKGYIFHQSLMSLR